jgi:hypothetical protein
MAGVSGQKQVAFEFIAEKLREPLPTKSGTIIQSRAHSTMVAVRGTRLWFAAGSNRPLNDEDVREYIGAFDVVGSPKNV